jgi:hypothetical protein
MRNSTISGSITTAVTRVNGSFDRANSVLRSFLFLKFMREPMGNWQEKRHTDSQHMLGLHAQRFLILQPSLTTRLWLAIAAPASQLAPVAVHAARAKSVRG